jgi:hypothetical protein
MPGSCLWRLPADGRLQPDMVAPATTTWATKPTVMFVPQTRALDPKGDIDGNNFSVAKATVVRSLGHRTAPAGGRFSSCNGPRRSPYLDFPEQRETGGRCYAEEGRASTGVPPPLPPLLRRSTAFSHRLSLGVSLTIHAPATALKERGQAQSDPRLVRASSSGGGKFERGTSLASFSAWERAHGLRHLFTGMQALCESRSGPGDASWKQQ